MGFRQGGIVCEKAVAAQAGARIDLRRDACSSICLSSSDEVAISMYAYDHRYSASWSKLAFLVAIGLTMWNVTPSDSQTIAAPAADERGRFARRAPLEPDTALAPVGPETYRLDRGDRVRIAIYDRDDLSGDYRVSDKGQIRVPQLGMFDARGKTTAELEEEIRRVFERMMQRPGYITADVSERRPFFVVGLIGKPGAYPFVPGMTVMHAMAFAGGIYRPASGSYLAGEMVREQTRLQQSAEDLSRLIARRTRLVAERDGKQTVEMPQKLLDLVGPVQAEEIIKQETEVLHRQLAALARDEASLRTTVQQTRREIRALELELAQVAEQRRIRDTQLGDLQRLAGRGLTTQQRVFDTQLALALLERDGQGAIAAIARAERGLEKASRDLDMVRMERNLKIDQEIVLLDENYLKAKSTLESARRFIEQVGGVPASAMLKEAAQPSVTFEIMRRDEAGATQMLAADETSTMQPGDVLRVNARVFDFN
jgi:protein involved in polysaccharide export with SLBB domain